MLRIGRDDFNLAAFTQAVGTVDDDFFTRLQFCFDRHPAAIDGARFDYPCADRTVGINHIHIETL
ncbi:hypothetical protein D3C81_2236850 [compost metagenome]